VDTRPAASRQLDAPAGLARRLGLTPREAEVLRWVAGRYGNAEIATLLGISKRTVESHMAALLQKCAVTDRAALIRTAAREPSRSTHTHSQRPPITDLSWLESVRATAAEMRTTAARQRTDAIRQTGMARLRTASARTRALTPVSRPRTGS
jgi:DNA-binding CsgD family transcriptional regulator